MLAARADLALRQADAVPHKGAHRHYPGAMPGRRANRARSFDVGMDKIVRDYFGVGEQPPVYSENDFERRFRVPRSIFEEIYAGVRRRPYWRQRTNATGRLQAHPLQKLVGAFRVLAYGEASDRGDEYVRLSASTIAEATRHLVDYLVERYEPTYLRPPTNEEVAYILERNAARGMPGCLGSIDCSHWRWVNCPTALAGQYQNRKGERTVVMETVSDEDLYIWHFYIGCPGSMNDLNVLSTSPLYHNIASGAWPPKDFPYTVNGRTRRLLYYLADGIYPRYAFFATPYSAPATPKQRVYNRLHEALRKDAERLYAVLTARFHIVLHPARYGTVARIIQTAKAVAILHNMVVAERRTGYLGRERMAARAADATSLLTEAVGPDIGNGVAHGETEGNADAEDEISAPMSDVEGGESSESIGAAPQPAESDGLGAGESEGGAVDSLDPPATHATIDAGGAVWGDARPPLPPPLPSVDGEPSPGSHLYSLLAHREATDREEHLLLRRDLTEHIWTQRGSVLAPYLNGG